MTVSSDPSVKEVLTAMAESSSIHGVSRWVTSKHWYQRTLWLIVFLGATGGAGYQLWRLFASYTSYPVKTSVELKFSQLPFPAVSFCNMNPIRSSKLSKTSNETQKSLQAKRKRSTDSISSSSSDVWAYRYLMKKIKKARKKYNSRVSNAKNETRKRRKKRNGIQTTTPWYNSPSFTTSGYYHDPYDWMYGASGSGDYSQYLYELESQNNLVKDVWNTRVDTFKSEFQNNDIFTREEVGHDISDMLVSCAFNGNKCYKENFTLFQSLEYGNCYTFQDASYITKQSGPLLGLRLVLNIETKEYINNYMDASGLRLAIHEPGTLPFPEEEGFTLNPNYETTIGMRMLSIHRASEPHGSCESGEEFFNLFGITYTIPACLKLCRQREIMTRCHCKPSTSNLDLGLEDMNKYSSCLETAATSHCEDYVIYQIENQHIGCNCRSPCNQIIYKTSLSGRTWPNSKYLEGNMLPEFCGTSNKKWYFENLCNSFTSNSLQASDMEWVEESILKAVIYYEDLNYEKISEEPLYDGFQLISDVGGALGLFMGASILSFVEVLQFMIELINFLRHKIASRMLKKTKIISLKDNNVFSLGSKS